MSEPLRVLIVEDSEDDALLVLAELRRAGYPVDWTRVQTAETMRRALADRSWDIIISDYRMPHFNAPAALAVLREFNLDLPFILVSGTIGEETAVASLQAGAHDFILKSRLARLAPAVARELDEARMRRERREALEALKRQEAYFRALTENATDMISVIGPDGTFLYGSPSARRLLGGERVGQNVFDSIHPDDLPRLRETFEALRQDPRLRPTVEVRFRRADGSWRMLEATGQNLLADPHVTGIVVTSRDITERKAAEEALAFGNVMLKTQQETSLDGILVVDESGRIVSYNQRFLDLWGVSPDVLRAGDDERALKSVLDRLVDPAGLVARVAYLYEHRDEKSQEEIALKDGRTFDRYSAPMFGADGHYYGRVWYFRDITERKNAERTLKAQEAQFRSLIENASDIITIIGPDGTIRYASPSTKRILGTSRNGENVFAFIHPDDQPKMRRAMQQVLADPSLSVRVEFRYLRADGSWRVLEGVGHNMLADPNVAGIVVNSRDVTDRDMAEAERRRAEEALAYSEAHYRALIEHSGDIILIIEATGVIRYASASFTRILGYTMAEATGVDAFAFVHPDDVPRTREAFAAALADPSRLTRVETRLRHKNGSWLHIDSTATNLLDNPNVGGIVVNARDETKRAELEAQYLQSQKMELVGKLAGGVAHDFNNLLTVIKANVQFLLDDLAAADSRRTDAEQIRDAADRAANLTRQLLAFSRRQVLQPTTLALDVVLADLEKMLRRLIGEDIVLRVERGEGPATIVADRGQLEQIIVNLCVNARDAMPDGGSLTLATRRADIDAARAAVTPGARSGRWVELSVSDTGIGMPPSVMARVFEPFFTTKASGTGLGLATVYGIVTQSGGFVTVDSEPGRGTTFHVSLPFAAAQATQRTAAPELPAPKGHETVLLVEDDASVRAVARRALEQSGYHVLVAAGADEAARMFDTEGQNVDLLMTDVVMPGKSGRALADELHARRPALPVLYMSGYTADLMEHYGPSEPGTFLLEKPFAVAALSHKVREVLDASRQATSAGRPG